MRHIEDDHQHAFMSWLAMAHPDVDATSWAVPNGGLRTARTGARLKASGVKRGVADITIAHPCHGKCGLFIEIKRPCVKGEPNPVVSSYQKKMLLRLREKGYSVAVAYGFHDAKMILTAYLQGMYLSGII